MWYLLKRFYLGSLLFLIPACAGTQSSNNASDLPGVDNTANGADDDSGGIVVSDATGEAVQGLTMISSAQVIDAVENGSGTRGWVRDVAVQDDYAQAKGRFYVHLEATESLNMLNMILCFADQFKASQFVNQGPYLAEVDEVACQKSSGQQSGDEGADLGLIPVTVHVTREHNGAPQKVHAWIPAGEEGPSEVVGDTFILVEAVITESPSEEVPFGRFTLAWEMPGGFGGGYIRAGVTDDGKGTFTLIESSSEDRGGDQDMQGPVTYTQRVGVVKNPDGQSGLAKTSIHVQGANASRSTAYVLGYNASHIAMRKGEEASCLDRNDFNTMVWKYGVYHAETGAEVLLEGRSDVRFKTTCNGSEVRGNVNYYGMWTERPECALRNGDVVSEEVNDRKNAVPPAWFTYHSAQGKLVRVTPVLKTLSELGDAEIRLHTGVQNPQTYQYEMKQYALRYIEGALKVVAEIQQAPNSPNENRTVFTPARALSTVVPEGQDWMGWLPSEGVGVAWFRNDPTHVVLQQEDTVLPDDTALSGIESLVLVCQGWNCPKGGATLQDFNSNNLYVSNYNPSTPGPTVVRYAFRKASMMLFQRSEQGTDVGPVVLPEGASGNQVHLGADRLVLEENLQSQDGLAVYYRWNTGLESWNKTSWLTNNADGSMVKFAKPVNIRYVHSTQKDRHGDSRYNGTEVNLTYAGKGNLWGIPGDQEEQSRMWVPRFTLKDGALLGRSGEYKVKALEGEQKPKVVQASMCQSVGVDESQVPVLPESVDVVPEVGERPEVLDAPKVSAGVVLEN